MSLIDQEVPLQPPFPEVELWSENFCLSSFDPKSGVGLWLHLGRWRKDLTFWREIVSIALPDGTIIAHRGIGNHLATPTGPGATNYAINVDEPGRQLTYTFKGGAHRIPAQNLRGSLLVNGPMVRTEFALVFQATSPVWELPGHEQEFLGSGHIEQLARVTGTITVGNQVIQYDGMGNRDHSMGPRKSGKLRRHHWLQGVFENGLGFLMFDAEEGATEKPTFSEAVVFDNDAFHNAKLTIPFRIDSLSQEREPTSYLLEYAKGSLNIRTSSIPNTWYLSYTAPNDTYIGVYPTGKPNPLTLLEQSVHWILNDTVKGCGHMERTVPGEIVDEPEN